MNAELLPAAAVPGVRLRDVARELSAVLIGDADPQLTSVVQDSRRVQPGALFAVRRGTRTDGRAHVPDALARGAAALLTDDESLAREVTIPSLVVPDARAAIGPVAAAVYGHPERAVAIVGVTGTNGKTTTTSLVASMLESGGARAAVLGTLGLRFGADTLPGTHTTPEADEVMRTLAGLVARGATHLVMEVSSHALEQHRVAGLPFGAAAFLNLTQDHLDFHGNMVAYGAAKARLFTDLSPASSVINIDDPFGAELWQRAAGRVIRVSARGDRSAEIHTREASTGAHGIEARFVTPSGDVAFRSPALFGAHNLENVAVALGIACALGLDPALAALALGNAPAAPGRMEAVSGAGDDLLVLVDYAHTPDALARVLDAARALTRSELSCVFGCGGDRDPGKRPLMGAVVAERADRIYVTNDNPRSEEPQLIADAILAGIRAPRRAPVVELDRAAAIHRAVAEASRGDCVIVAGKGHEPYQIVGSQVRPFDDREQGRLALVARRGGQR